MVAYLWSVLQSLGLYSFGKLQTLLKTSGMPSLSFIFLSLILEFSDTLECLSQIPHFSEDEPEAWFSQGHVTKKGQGWDQNPSLKTQASDPFTALC